MANRPKEEGKLKMSVPMKQPAVTGDIMESVLLKGDLAKLTPDERVRYYGEVCESMGLNPLTKPFEFITLNGKLQLYALRSCTDQLRKIDKVSLEIISKEVAAEILTVHVRAKLPDGRIDEDLGAVAFPAVLKGEARANAELKCITKAKRRATLSICGLGWLDETEIEDIPASAKRPPRPPRPAPDAMQHNPETGELPPKEAPRTVPPAANSAPAPSDVQHTPDSDRGGAGAALSLEDMAREAAMRGEATFKQFYKGRTKSEQRALQSIAGELRELMDNADAEVPA